MTTPDSITDCISEWCQTIAPDCPLIYITVTPEGIPQFCYDNVDNYIRRNGGVKTYGWIIWSMGNEWIEAEPHCVVRQGSAYIDPTPQVDGEPRILFLVDDQARHNTKKVNQLVVNDATTGLLRLASIQQRNIDTYNKMRRIG